MSLATISPSLTYRQGTLHMGAVSLDALAATYGTPLYVYSAAHIRTQWKTLTTALPRARLHYAMKANSNRHLLRFVHALGAHFDIVSGGELARLAELSVPGEHIIFSGVGKSTAEINAALNYGIHAFHVESLAELTRIGELAAARGVIANIGLRINPAIGDAAKLDTHPYITTGNASSKFGVSFAEAHAAIAQIAAKENLTLKALACHIGSQIQTSTPFIAALNAMTAFIREHDLTLDYLDLGGGLGIAHKMSDNPADFSDYFEAINAQTTPIALEPGRFLVGNAGVLVSRVEYIKPRHGATNDEAKHFLIVDAAMNDLMRPSLYDAHHEIIAVKEATTAVPLTYDIAGPVCESGDILGKNRALAVSEGDLIAILSAGAYGYALANTYNLRARPCEIWVEGGEHTLITPRDTL